MSKSSSDNKSNLSKNEGTINLSFIFTLDPEISPPSLKDEL